MNRQEGHGAERDETSRASDPATCAAFASLLEPFYYHTLEPDETQTVADHIAACASCAAVIERLAATDRLIAEAPAPLPGPELRQRLAARIAVARASRSAVPAALTPFERNAVVSDLYDFNDLNDSGLTRTPLPTKHTSTGMQRVRVLLGTVAAVLIVALLAGVFLTKTHGATATQTRSGHDSGPAATAACSPGSIQAHLPANSYLYDLSMVSPSEGWAVGSIQDTQHAGPVNSLIMRFHNCAWTPVATNYPDAVLQSVSMDSAQDGWAVGGVSGGAPLVLHYTNGAWIPETLPGESTLKGIYSAVHMLSSTEGWVVITHQKNAQGLLSQGLLHLVNGKWSAVDTPFSIVMDLLPVAPNEAWAAGYLTDGAQTPVLYHYQAGQWTAATLPSGVAIDSLRMVSPNDIWASGHINAATNWEVDQSSAVLHYNGATWTPVNYAQAGKAQIIQAFDGTTSWAFTLKNTRIIGDFGYVISATQYQQAGAWQRANLPLSVNLYDVSSLTRVAANEFWGISSYSLTQPNTNGGDTASYSVTVLVYFAHGAWHVYGQ